MPQIDRPHMSFDEFDEINYPRPARTDFDRIVERALTRRSFLTNGVAYGTGAFVMATAGLAPKVARATSRIGFRAVAANSGDIVTVPDGYSWHIVAKWGEPLWSNGIAFDQTTRGTGESQELAFGDNTDGMELYSVDDRHILAVNCEYTNLEIIYGGRESGKPEGPDDVRKGKAAHGARAR